MSRCAAVVNETARRLLRLEAQPGTKSRGREVQPVIGADDPVVDARCRNQTREHLLPVRLSCSRNAKNCSLRRNHRPSACSRPSPPYSSERTIEHSSEADSKSRGTVPRQHKNCGALAQTNYMASDSCRERAKRLSLGSKALPRMRSA